MSAGSNNHASYPTPRSYFMIYIALLGLLALTVGATFVNVDHWLPGGHWSLAIAILIAVGKALLIMSCFMHLRSDPSRPILFAAAGFVWLMILMTLTLCDYMTR